MNQNYIIYNPFAGTGNCKYDAEILYVIYDNIVFIDINKITNYQVFLSGLDTSDSIILCGGDGTLNRFVNSSKNIDIRSDIYFFSVGNGNDFVQDLGKDKFSTPDFKINSYIEELPTAKINGKEKLFINGIGYGMNSSYIRTPDDDRRSSRKKRFSSKMDVLREFLFRNKPIEMTITIDGKSYIYKKVWLAYTMKGRYLRGTLVAPEQNRHDESIKLSFEVVHGVGRLKALQIYYAMENGKHLKYKNGVDICRGNSIHVAFGNPVLLQVDGNAIDNVEEYWVRSDGLLMQNNT